MLNFNIFNFLNKVTIPPNALGFKNSGKKSGPSKLKGWKNRRSWADKDDADFDERKDNSASNPGVIEVSSSQGTVIA
jgi:hypothetical protein